MLVLMLVTMIATAAPALARTVRIPIDGCVLVYKQTHDHEGFELQTIKCPKAHHA